jgi:hypothetical protein
MQPGHGPPPGRVCPASSRTAVLVLLNLVQLYSRRCISTGDFGVFLTRVAPSVLFGIFQKVIANLVRYMQVLTLSSRHARAPVRRRPCCRSLKAGYIVKYNTQW